MSATSLISTILNAKSLADVFSIKDYKDEYKKAIRLIHPDICQEKGASDATAKLHALKDAFEKGKKYTDESGDFFANGYWAKYSGNKDLLKKSVENYNKLKSIRVAGFDHTHFAKYMPEKYELTDDGLTISFNRRAMPLSGMKLTQMQTNWVFARLIEFNAMLEHLGYTHLGFNPESIFVVDGNEKDVHHAIYITSFYHLQKTNSKVTTIAAKYKEWYPTALFSEKIAKPYMDIELSKRLSVYLLGDQSGSGVKLKTDKNVSQKFLSFVSKSDKSAFKTFTEYRAFLTANFPQQSVPIYV